jgi:carboxypeptidase Taq
MTPMRSDVTAEQPAPRGYDELLERWAEISDLGRARALLAWDERTMMPPGGAAGRAEQIATLVRIRHERITAERLWELVGELEAGLGDADTVAAATVRAARRDCAKARRVPAELRAERARAASRGETAWAAARESSDLERFLPHLERNVELAREYAACFEPAGHLYDPLLDDFEPGLATATAERLLAELRAGLVPLVAALSERPAAGGEEELLRGSFPPHAQERMLRELTARLPLEPGRWRLDRTTHPFAASISDGDIRLSTRYEPDDLAFGLFSVLHEAGHGIYEAGIPAELRRGPIGRPASLAFHESQSRLWENWVGRSRPFLRALLPVLRGEFDVFDDVGAEQLYRAANVARPSLIRVEADEVTYNLHIALRFELELGLFEGTLEVADLPAAWIDRTRSYLGLEVPDHANGVMQDVHWAAGEFGYFPTYALGNLIAAQLWERAGAELGDLDELIAAGALPELRDWLGERVHRHGARYLPAELAERTLGGPIEVAPLLDRLRTKYGELYSF